MRDKTSSIEMLAAEAADTDGVSLDDFYAYMPMHCYIYAPSREMWPASSVNARIPPIPGPGGKGVAASAWLDQHKSVEQMTWSPGLPMLVRDRLISEGGWIERSGVSCFNLYRAPTIEPGNAVDAGPWLEHVRKVFGTDAEHITAWLAHRVQHPARRSTTRWCLAATRALARTRCLSR